MCLKNSIYIIALFFFLALTQTAFAESFRWTDEQGVLHFSDRRPVERLEKKASPSLQVSKKAEEKVDRKKELYDFREKVVNVIGVDKILLESGKIVKYIGVSDPAKYLTKNGLHEKVDEAEQFHSKLVIGKDVTVLLGKKSKNETTYNCPSMVVQFIIHGIPTCSNCGRDVSDFNELTSIKLKYTKYVCNDCFEIFQYVKNVL